MTRVMVAMSLDRLLPEQVSRVSDRFHTPVNAHVIYFLASIPVILPVQQLRVRERRRHDDLGVPDAWRDLRLRLRVRGHRPGRRAAAVPGQGALRGVSGLSYTVGGFPLVTFVGLARRR